MKPIKNFDNVQPLSEVKKLPAGGYIINILNCEEIAFDKGGSALKFSFDIADGEYKDFYKENYNNQQQEDKKWKGTYYLFEPKEDGSQMDEFTTRKFKTCIAAIEESTNGYRFEWDEKTLGGRKVGAIFRDKEWEFNGNTGFTTEVYTFTTIKNIKEGKFKIPEAKLLTKKASNLSGIPDFVPMPTEDDMPDWMK